MIVFLRNGSDLLSTRGTTSKTGFDPVEFGGGMGRIMADFVGNVGKSRPKTLDQPSLFLPLPKQRPLRISVTDLGREAQKGGIRQLHDNAAKHRRIGCNTMHP